MAAGTATVVITGELDAASAQLLAVHLAWTAGAGARHVVFDMAGVSFADCATMRLITGAARLLPGGRRPAVRQPGPVVRRVLALTGLGSHCDVIDAGR